MKKLASVFASPFRWQHTEKSVADPVSVFINDFFAVLFGKCSLLRVGQNIQNRFRRTTESCAERRHHHRTVDKDGVSQHCIQQFVIAEPIFCQPQLLIRLCVFAQQGARAQLSAF